MAIDATDQRQAAERAPTGCRRWSSIDPGTGAVKAMVGGPDFADSQYNIATSPDGRQTGSTWKVITLAAALANGYSPNDIVDGTSPCSRAEGLRQRQRRSTPSAGEGGYDDLWAADRRIGQLRVRALCRPASARTR